MCESETIIIEQGLKLYQETSLIIKSAGLGLTLDYKWVKCSSIGVHHNPRVLCFIFIFVCCLLCFYMFGITNLLDLWPLTLVHLEDLGPNMKIEVIYGVFKHNAHLLIFLALCYRSFENEISVS